MGRLALERGGEAIDNPFAWWDSLPDGVVEFWQAYYRVEPFGGQWHRHATTCMMLDRLALRFSAERNERIQPFASWMPADWVELGQKTEQVPISKQLDAVAKVQAKNGHHNQ
jgi:hypothetical protein